MRVLLFSTVFYLAGIAIVLFIRPPFMFHHDGRWKEFGLSDQDTTVFPFWLFCIAWALISFVIGRAFFSDSDFSLLNAAKGVGAVAAGPQTLLSRLRGPAAEAEENENFEAEEEEGNEPPTKRRAARGTTTTVNYENAVKPIAPPPRAQRKSRAAAEEDVADEGMSRPGYYVLNKNATRRSGQPKYVYYGTEPPSSEED